MIGEWLDSPIRCRCGKRMVLDLGQDSTTGWVHEHHQCLDCGNEVRERPRADRTPYVLGVKEILARRLAHLDRDPGKTLLVSEIAKMTRAEFEEWANGAHP